jgi:prevent-host-death family protein
VSRPQYRGTADHWRFEARGFREATVRELSRDTSRLLREVREEGRIIVCRHGDPVAVILSVEDGLDWALSRMEGEAADRIHQDLLKGRYEQVRRARREIAFELLGERLGSVAMGRLVKDGEWLRW